MSACSMERNEMMERYEWEHKYVGEGNMTMDKSIFLKLMICISCMVFGSVTLAQEEISSEDIWLHVYRKLSFAYSDYKNQRKYCDGIKDSRQSLQFDKTRLRALGVTREDALIAIRFLWSRNDFLCEKETGLQVLFHFNTMKPLRNELLGVDPRSTENFNLLVLSVEAKMIREIRYFSLSEQIRIYFESVIGNEPFDLMTILEVNDLQIPREDWP